MAVGKGPRAKENLRLIGLVEKLAVPVERLRRSCDPATMPFETTEQVEPLLGTVGQERAISAIEFGVEI
ncbi:MAG: hypothetical protein M1380_11515, partial [Chloroflexi bacterium]|nr:hypothetical protein [Chloroflexota bacterium]